MTNSPCSRPSHSGPPLVAAIADRPELPVVEEQGDGPAVELEGAGNAAHELGAIAEAVPGGHRGAPVWCGLNCSPYARHPRPPRRHLLHGLHRPGRVRDRAADPALLRAE